MIKYKFKEDQYIKEFAKYIDAPDNVTKKRVSG